MSGGALGATASGGSRSGGRNDSNSAASLHLASVAAAASKPKAVAAAAAPIDHETPAQKQAAAKLALRKQLEKTLLQVNGSPWCNVWCIRSIMDPADFKISQQSRAT